MLCDTMSFIITAKMKNASNVIVYSAEHFNLWQPETINMKTVHANVAGARRRENSRSERGKNEEIYDFGMVIRKVKSAGLN